ncbi:M20/M25/M40 family metallo-hydrolase [Collimonas pratensis]|uniref:Peptidase M20/M25/M40 family protein n=1 Tax=Collimonas pratensis TaxID=279113 RepID=A0A127PYW7_9BURK|nr:M20/M25/M40 family metallo-hydrolase [Collimonas pratensis]AMP02954.1 peptidase M20/M25/M40 family protein [Collimonas pratensis]
MKRLLAGAALSLVLSTATAAEGIAPHYRELLERLVNINTETHNLAGLEQVRQLLIPQFESLGLVLTRHRLAQDGREVLSFEMPGAQPKVLLVGHLDTVFPVTGAFQKLKDQGNRLAGPGVIDMKGGVVLLLNVLAQLKEHGGLDQVRVALNDDEEIGSPNSKATLRDLAQGLPFGLVFEPGLEDGSVVSSQSGVRWIKLTTTGKAAHAGLEPEKGIDACLDLAIKVKKVAGLAQAGKGLTINPGLMDGGSKPNVVCENASVTFDIRFRSLADWQDVSSAIRQIGAVSDVYNASLQQGTHTEVTQLAEMPLLPVADTAELLERIQTSARSLGQTVGARAVGYGSDGNNLAETGMQLLVGVGPYGGGMHSDQEFMLLRSYQERLSLITLLITQLSHSQKGTS